MKYTNWIKEKQEFTNEAYLLPYYHNKLRLAWKAVYLKKKKKVGADLDNKINLKNHITEIHIITLFFFQLSTANNVLLTQLA